MWNQDHFGFPINARPFSAIGTAEKIEIAEVINQMIRRACDYEKSKIKMTTPTTTTITTTPAYRAKAKITTKEAEAFKTEEADRVLVQPVVAEAAYPNLVSNNKMNSLAIFS